MSDDHYDKALEASAKTAAPQPTKQFHNMQQRISELRRIANNINDYTDEQSDSTTLQEIAFDLQLESMGTK